MENNNNKRVVLIGALGYGKTTLFNRLTGSQEKAIYGLGSTTRNIIRGFSKALPPEKSFEVVDTPGLGSIEDKMEHTAGILAAFKQNVVHRIIFVIKYEKTDMMIRNIKTTLKFFEKYKENITIYVSFFDQFYQDSIKVQNQIRSKIEENLKINSFIFNENNSTSNDLNIIKQFNQILEKSQQINVQFQIDQIIENFDLFELNDSDDLIKLQDFIMIVTRQYRSQVQNPILKFLDNFPKQITDPLYLNYLDELQIFSKQIAEQLLEKFIQEHSQEMNDQFEVNSINSQYAPYISLQLSLKSELSKIIEKINQKKQKHPNFIGSKVKACPYCGLLWVRDYGCNRILCGDSAGKYNPTLKLKPFVKFEYKLENNQVKLIENDIQLFKDKDELKEKLKDSFKHQQFEQIIELFNIKNDKDFINLLQKEFDDSCFDQWIQIIDKRNYNEFLQNLTELLINSINKPKEGTKGLKGCGKYFLWESEILGRQMIYKTALSLTSQQIAELNDKDLFTISILENIDEQKKLSIWLMAQEIQLNKLIKQQIDQMKVAKQKQQQEQQLHKQSEKQKDKCRMF